MPGEAQATGVKERGNRERGQQGIVCDFELTQLAHHCFHGGASLGFDFDVERYASGGQLTDLAQTRQGLAVGQTHVVELVEARASDLQVWLAGAPGRRVVRYHRDAVERGVDVEFDAIGALRDGELKRFE